MTALLVLNGALLATTALLALYNWHLHQALQAEQEALIAHFRADLERIADDHNRLTQNQKAIDTWKSETSLRIDNLQRLKVNPMAPKSPFATT